MATEPCPECGQTDIGQHGEYPCPSCGLPLTWDEPTPAAVPHDGVMPPRCKCEHCGKAWLAANYGR